MGSGFRFFFDYPQVDLNPGSPFWGNQLAQDCPLWGCRKMEPCLVLFERNATRKSSFGKTKKEQSLFRFWVFLVLCCGGGVVLFFSPPARPPLPPTSAQLDRSLVKAPFWRLTESQAVPFWRLGCYWIEKNYPSICLTIFVYFPLLALKGIYDYWTNGCFFFFSPGGLSK